MTEFLRHMTSSFKSNSWTVLNGTNVFFFFFFSFLRIPNSTRAHAHVRKQMNPTIVLGPNQSEKKDEV
jgi:hypothetical protein